MIVDGKKITGASPYYENIMVWLDTGEILYMSPTDLTTILSEHLFEVEEKKTRTWLHPVTPDVDLLYDQDKYPTK
jgi:hypothetical protein